MRSFSSVVTDDFIYTGNTNGKAYDHSGNKLDSSDYEAIVANYRRQLELSDLIVKKDGLKK